MFRPPGAFGAAPPPLQQPQPWQWQQPFHPPAATSFWQQDNVQEHMGRLQETIDLASAVINELEEIALARNSSDATAQEHDLSSAKSSSEHDGFSAEKPRCFVELARAMEISQDTHESLATDAANYLCSQLQNLLAPIYPAVNQGGPWEEMSAMIRLSQKLQKSKRNKRWRRKKRKHVAELYQKEHADYDRIDQEADEWRARQIAKDIAQRKTIKFIDTVKSGGKHEANCQEKSK
uniref:Uncharacterized protein n=1 Tax=Oryza brachyantha TaxID=4533 RepID=J3KXW1_ORYBR